MEDCSVEARIGTGSVIEHVVTAIGAKHGRGPVMMQRVRWGGNDRPRVSANITRLRVLFRDCRTDVETLEEIRDELRRRRKSAAKELLKLVEEALDALADKQANSNEWREVRD
jgi:sigma54-dependent transcription regulator